MVHMLPTALSIVHMPQVGNTMQAHLTISFFRLALLGGARNEKRGLTGAEDGSVHAMRRLENYTQSSPVV